MTSDDYLLQIVEPTIKELEQDSTSKRRAFLACLATYHVIDHLCGKRRKAVLRQEYCAESAAFGAVDRIANTRFQAKPGPTRDRLSAFGKANAARLAPEEGAAVLALVNQAKEFLSKKVREHASQEDQPTLNDTYYIVVPFDPNAQGELEPGLPREVINAVRAERLARTLAAEHAGAIAFSRTGDHETGEFSDAIVLAKFGDVDLNAMR